MLWAWQRHENLTFINQKTTGVAMLVATITLKNKKVLTEIRRTSIKLAQGTYTIPVIRIENRSKHTRIRFYQDALNRELEFLTRDYPAFQLDFDARKSELHFYKNLLTHFSHKKVFITALASWCMRRGWLQDAPVLQVVPMAFDMSHDSATIKRYLEQQNKFAAPKCNQHLGLATYEKYQRLPRRQSYWLFHNKPWSRQAYQKMLKKLGFK